MSNISFLSALYIKAPPSHQQGLFKNCVTISVVNFSEYLFSIPCKYPSYTASLNLDLSEVSSSALTKIGLIVIWTIAIIIRGQNLWMVGSTLACVKMLNRSVFSDLPSPQKRTLPSSSLPRPIPFQSLPIYSKKVKPLRYSCSEGWELLSKSLANEITDEDHIRIGQQVRTLAVMASRSPSYLRLNQQFGRSNPYVALLQDLCATLYWQIPDAEELRELGGVCLKEAQGLVSYLATVMDKAFEERDTSVFEALDKVHTDQENFGIVVGRFKLGNRSIKAVFGARLKRDGALKVHLDSLSKRGGIHLQQGLAESPRALYKLEKQYPSVIRVFSMPFEGVTSSYFLDFKTVEEFMMKYAKFALCNQTSEDLSNGVLTIDAIDGESHLQFNGEDDNGFYFSQDVMDSRQFKLAFESAAKAFSHVDPTQGYKKRTAHALQLGVQGFLTVGAIVKILQDLPPDSQDEFMTATFKQAFEQDVDRAIVMNVLTEIYFRLISGELITEEIISEVIEIVVARAELVVGHQVYLNDYQQRLTESDMVIIDPEMREDFKIQTDLLRIIRANQKHVQAALRSYLHDGFNIDAPCGFEAYVGTELEILLGCKRHEPIQNKGSYGSIIYRDRQGRPYGVFKSVNAQFSLGKKVKSQALDMLWITGQEGYLPLPSMRQVGAMISERATYLLDRALNTELVPTTEIIDVQGKGSFQHFLHGYKEAEQVVLPELKDITTKDLSRYQKFAILDFLLGNLDRKLDNWMVILSEDGKHFKAIKLIDNANCFPRGHLPRMSIPDGSTWSQYAWKGLELSAAPLTRDSMKFIDTLTDEKIDQIICLWKEDLGPDYFETFFGGDGGAVIKAFKDRVRVLRKFNEESTFRTLQELASYNTYEAILAYLGKTEASPADYVLPTGSLFEAILAYLGKIEG